MEIDFKGIVSKYGSPVYIYSFDMIRERLLYLKTHFDDCIKVYYAVKANPNLELIKSIAPMIDGLDVSSGGEIKQSVLAGYDPDRMSFAGPGKTESEIEYAIKAGVGSISVESMDDFERIVSVGRNLAIKPNISIRINPSKLINKFAVKMGGRPTQFGIDEECIDEFADRTARDFSYVNFKGFHIYAGTQSLDADSISEGVDYNLNLIESLFEKFGVPSYINLGGGFGVPYHDAGVVLDIDYLTDAINKRVKAFCDKYKGIKVVFELGRYIVAEAGFYVTTVKSVKVSREKRFVIVDGGMHHNLSASGNLGQVIKKNYIIDNITSPDAPVTNVELSGSLCTPIDTLGYNLSIPMPSKNDLIVIRNSGAYGFTASPLMFLGHETPMEIMVKDGKPSVIRNSFDITKFNG